MLIAKWILVIVLALVLWGFLRWLFTIPWTKRGREEWRRMRELTERDPYTYQFDPKVEELNASPRIISRYAGYRLAALGWEVAAETVRHVNSDTKADGLSRRLSMILIKVGSHEAIPGLLIFLNAFPKPVYGHGTSGSEWNVAAALGEILERCHRDVPTRILKRAVRMLPAIAQRRRERLLDLDALGYEANARYPGNTTYDCALRTAFHFAQEELDRRVRAKRRQPALHLTSADHLMRSRVNPGYDSTWASYCEKFNKPEAVATGSFTVPVKPPEHNGHRRVSSTTFIWLRGRLMILDWCPSILQQITDKGCAKGFVDENNQRVSDPGTRP